MTETLRVGDLNFEVRRSLRRQTLGLTVDRAGELRVHAPESFAVDDLQRWIKSKLVWVYQKLALQSETAPALPEPEFVSGESFCYLGRNHRLRLVDDQAAPLAFDGKRFNLRRDARRDAAAHFRRWFIDTGGEWLEKRAQMFIPRTGSNPARIAVTDLGFRWGSCGRQGVLYFNWRLLQLPVPFVDYVIIHELVHLKEPHHGPKFWRALEPALPDWQKRKEEMRLRAAEFLAFGLAKPM